MATGASLPEHRAMPERRTSEGVESTLQVVAAQRVAQATVTGFAFCEECGSGGVRAAPAPAILRSADAIVHATTRGLWEVGRLDRPRSSRPPKSEVGSREQHGRRA